MVLFLGVGKRDGLSRVPDLLHNDVPRLRVGLWKGFKAARERISLEKEVFCALWPWRVTLHDALAI